jgi:hypothetical protein
LNEIKAMIMKKNIIKLTSIAFALSIGFTAAFVQAKLPAPAPLNDEQKAKAEEAKVKAAEGAKKEADLLAKYQDKAAENFKSRAAKQSTSPATASPSAPAAAPTAVTPEAKKP